MKINKLFIWAFLVFNMSYAQEKPNVLFIAIDDLRPELGSYGSDVAITPNLDAFAQKSLQFNRAYCQEAICSPSRASLMTGARPETIGVIENYTYFRDVNPTIKTIPQHFRKNGYETVYTGKIFHGAYNDPKLSWSRKPVKLPKGKIKLIAGFALPENQKDAKENKAKMIVKYGKGATKKGLAKGRAYECADVPDNTYEDGYNTEVAIATLKELNAQGKPFFLGLGFKKPHLNWTSPKKYWDLYDRENIKLSNQNTAPIDGAVMGLHPSFELRVRSGIPKSGKIDDELATTLKHAYLACVSYVDAQIGKVMQELEASGLAKNTIVVVWSDHGWHLGDMGIWGKATNYEIATRVPLIIHAPNMKAKGKQTEALVELIDIFPTLCDLTGLDRPNQLEGKSFVPLMKKPNKKWKKAVYSQFPSPALREWAANPLSVGMRETFFGPLINEVEARIITQQKENWDKDLFENKLMGYAMRTDKYRFIVWKDYTKPNAKPIYLELYDHTKDPNETVNIASKEPKIVKNLLKHFYKDWDRS